MFRKSAEVTTMKDVCCAVLITGDRQEDATTRPQLSPHDDSSMRTLVITQEPTTNCVSDLKPAPHLQVKMSTNIKEIFHLTFL